MTDDLEAAWAAVHDATLPAGTSVGRASTTSSTSGRCTPFDQREQAKVGVRSRDWTAVGATEVECLLEMARCLGDLAAGRVPS